MTIKILTVGHSCIDVSYHVTNLPTFDYKIAANNFEIDIGGNAANVAAAFRQFGGHVDICTTLGSLSHPLTRVLISLLNGCGIGTQYIEYNESADCSVSTVLITPDGSRTIVNYTNPQLESIITVPDNLTEYHMILGDSYRLPMVSKVFEVARAQGVKTMLDIDKPVDLYKLPKCDYAWFSKESSSQLNCSLSKLQEYFGGIVGITMGELPVCWIGSDQTIMKYAPTPIKAVNTLGAGDVFRARFAFEICQNTNIDLAVELASKSAGEYIQTRIIQEIL